MCINTKEQSLDVVIYVQLAGEGRQHRSNEIKLDVIKFFKMFNLICLESFSFF